MQSTDTIELTRKAVGGFRAAVRRRLGVILHDEFGIDAHDAEALLDIDQPWYAWLADDVTVGQAVARIVQWFRS